MLKDTLPDELVKAFEKVRGGSPYLSGDLAMQVALVRDRARRDRLADLTPRELETLSSAGERQALRPDRRGSSSSAIRPWSTSRPSSSRSSRRRNLPDLIRLAVQLLSAPT